jgi:tetratricopeptide (TPR) repeat protein
VLANQYNNRAIQRQNAGRLDEALADLDAAIRHQKIALAAVPDHVHYRERLGNHLRTRLYGLRIMGRHQQVAADADALLDLGRDEVKNWVNAGAILLSAVPAVDADATLDATARARERQDLIERGVDRLRQAMQLGFHDADKFAGADFDFVRDDPLMQSLLTDLAQAAAAVGKVRERAAR